MSDDFWDAYIEHVKPLQKGKGRLLPTLKPNEMKRRPIEVVLQPRAWKGEAPETWARQSVQSLHSKDTKHKTVEARLDLHGYTVSMAEQALQRFFTNAQLSDKRFVLVITGKGHPERGSVIRDSTLAWFKSHAECVVAFGEARAKDGGAGAFYVHVRRLRTF